jgi:hypothetical protein
MDGDESLAITDVTEEDLVGGLFLSSFDEFEDLGRNG